MQATAQNHIAALVEELSHLAVPNNATLAQRRVSDFFHRCGYECKWEHPVPYRRSPNEPAVPGRIDLLVSDPKNRHPDIAIEIDDRVPRKKSIEKLLLLEGVVRMLLLRRPSRVFTIPQNIHYLVQLSLETTHTSLRSSARKGVDMRIKLVGKGTVSSLSDTSKIVLGLIAEGRTYEQILALHPSFTYHDIFKAANEALTATVLNLRQVQFLVMPLQQVSLKRV